MQSTFHPTWLPVVDVRGRSRAADWCIHRPLDRCNQTRWEGEVRRKKELAELPFVSRFAEEYGEETGANLHCKSCSKHGTMFVEHMTSWRTFKLIHFGTAIEREQVLFIASLVCLCSDQSDITVPEQRQNEWISFGNVTRAGYRGVKRTEGGLDQSSLKRCSRYLSLCSSWISQILFLKHTQTRRSTAWPTVITHTHKPAVCPSLSFLFSLVYYFQTT